MNILTRDQQIQVIAALTEGMSIRAVERLTGIHRDTIMRLSVRAGRLELDELWQYVGKKQRRMTRDDGMDKGDQYTFIALAASSRAIISYQTGKRDGFTTNDFMRDLSERVIGRPEISTDGFPPYATAVRAAFGARADYGRIVKTYSVTNLATPEAARRYSPAEVVAVSREIVTGMPTQISTSYVERSNLSIRMASRRFTRLTNGFSKKLENHCAAVSLYVAHYNLCRPHESLSPSAMRQITPAMAAGISDHVWSIGELLDAVLSLVPTRPNPHGRRRQFRVIKGGKS